MSGGHALLIAASALLGVGVPWLSMRMLMPSLEGAEKSHATNFRGVRVSYGLGIVWFVWAGCAIVCGVLSSATGEAPVMGLLMFAGLLALVAFTAGVVDDAYGSPAARGFAGHLKAMAKGRLTTGGLKLIAIGAASLVVSLMMAQVSPWGGVADVSGSGSLTVSSVGWALMAGAAIALTSNLLNLLDLRPGRALKVYSLLGAGGVLSAGVMLSASPIGQRFGASPGDGIVTLLGLALFVFGPVIAVWPFDLGERGMLGDAGANPMGVVAGLLIVSGLPAWGLVAYFILVLGLNLLSERVSFTRVISSVPVLRALDEAGRSSGRRGTVEPHGSSEESSPDPGTEPE